jgi:putative spermidine/putrescine transport system permease protein
MEGPLSSHPSVNGSWTDCEHGPGIVSFDEVVISLFLVGPTLRTLPVEVFSYVNYRVAPQIAALSVILIGVSVLFVLLIERCVGVLRALGRQ